MSKRDYLSYIDNNHIRVDIEKVPDTAFIQANKVVEIGVAVILDRRTHDKLERGGPDVSIKSVSGEKYIVTRKELCSNFKHASGKKIVLAFLKNDTPYPVYRTVAQSYRVLKLPNNYQGVLRGKAVSSGSFIVCKADGNGALLKETMTTVAPKMFKKMFKIPMQEVIKCSMDSARKEQIQGIAVSIDKLRKADTPITTNTGIRMGVKSLAKEPVDINNIKNMLKANLVKSNDNEIGQKIRYPYKATHRIINGNNHNVVGFVIQEISTGKSKQITLDNVKILCRQRKVENIMLVEKDGTGLEFLRGNGIRLESLPEVLM